VPESLESLLNKVTPKMPPAENGNALFEQKLEVFNIGLEGFAEELTDQGVAVTQLNWRPPAGGDAELADILSKLGS
jgi:hypothetical protein